MELHQLRYMIAVAEEGTFSKAAIKCHIAQPSLSSQIIKLEDELGERLFHRTKRKAVLTPVGAAFLEQARKILNDVRIARQEVLEFGKLDRGTVRAGVLPTIAPYFFAEALTEFSQKFRHVEVVIVEDTTQNLIQAVESGSIEFAIIAEPVSSRLLSVQKLLTESLLVAIPADFPAPAKEFIHAKQLENARFILMREEHCLGRQSLEACYRGKINPNVVLETAQIETIIALVEAGVGISLIPEMAVKRMTGRRIRVRKLRPHASRTLFAVRRSDRDLSQAAFQFWQALATRVSNGSQGSQDH
jgi:LysR family hydrogen peroxide-inducible transcriptional activator